MEQALAAQDTASTNALKAHEEALTAAGRFVSFQKQVDAFEFQLWTEGASKRRLTFGCYEHERTWEHVEGSPEPWEAAAWHGQPPVVGSDEPSIDGRDTAEAVAVAYGLPGWE